MEQAIWRDLTRSDSEAAEEWHCTHIIPNTETQNRLNGQAMVSRQEKTRYLVHFPLFYII